MSVNSLIRRDAEMLWRPGRVWLPAMQFTGVAVGAINEGGAGNFAYGEKWEGSHTGAPITKEISTFGVNGILMDTAGDEVNTYMPIPYDVDISLPLHVRVHWASGSTDTADTITFKVWYRKVVIDTTAIAANGNTGGTALDTLVGSDTQVGTAYTWQATGWGAIDTRVTAIADNVEAILWSVELDAFAAGLSEDKFFLGLELRYTPKRLAGVDGMYQEAKLGTYKFSKEFAN